MNHLHFDCFNGISGDMTLAALVDAGASADYLESQLQLLKLKQPFQLHWKYVQQHGIRALSLTVEEVKQETSHQAPHHHSHFSEIVQIIEDCALSHRTKELALAIFTPIAHAEAKIHQITIEKVHFHEVGALDSIIDIVGIAIALDHLQITSLSSSPVPVGQGKIKIQHGLYPVPAPATMELLKGIPLQSSPLDAELTTPTGAAILTALVQQYGPIPSMTIQQVGYGAGTRQFLDRPNIMRLMIGRLA